MGRKVRVLIRSLSALLAAVVLLWPVFAYALGFGIEQFEPRGGYVDQLLIAIGGSAVLLMAVVLGFKAQDRRGGLRFLLMFTVALCAFMIWVAVLDHARPDLAL